MRLRRLPGAAGLSLRAWLALAETDVHLRTRGFARCLAAYTSEPATKTQPRDVSARAQRYVRAIERAARLYPGTARCLHQSLVLYRWLHHEGVSTQLQIGVVRGKAADAFRAHAWVELDGRILNDRAAAVRPFTPLTTTMDPLHA
ncbi:MAG: lasso peptide biosynthesis B2 protein [Chloroflexi bacterium]|nr:lasso peptide biosynthesis B2 protein [Chloroflexota bacterium]